MDNNASLDLEMVQARLSNKINQVNSAAQAHLAPLQDHVGYTLQQAYFKCAYECFDRRKQQQEINNCVENCTIPVVKAQGHMDHEVGRLQERMQRAMMVCQDKFQEAKFNATGSDAIKGLESCIDQSIQDTINSLPNMVERLKSSLSIPEQLK
ncbi:hypothetical protein Tsubulata_020827 [Turnera subulata]|uniref:Protein FAM136A n=1 Tax=Turnera subulata TaxID=218843 RepID=A0A9Q0G3J5_9ROSI|nr:hypothetical protein Tsubulata_020827 [Turnera subulata]